MSSLRILALFAVLACMANRACSLPVGEIVEEPIIAEASNVDYVEAIPISLLDVDSDAGYSALDANAAESNVELQRSTRGLGLGLLSGKLGGFGLGGLGGLGGLHGGLHGLGGLGGLGSLGGLGGLGGFKSLFHKFG